MFFWSLIGWNGRLSPKFHCLSVLLSPPCFYWIAMARQFNTAIAAITPIKNQNWVRGQSSAVVGIFLLIYHTLPVILNTIVSFLTVYTPWIILLTLQEGYKDLYPTLKKHLTIRWHAVANNSPSKKKRTIRVESSATHHSNNCYGCPITSLYVTIIPPKKRRIFKNIKRIRFGTSSRDIYHLVITFRVKGEVLLINCSSNLV